MNSLRVGAPYGSGTLRPVKPFVSDHDDAAAVPHLSVHDLVLGIGQDLTDFKAKGIL
jgi:hypothetical protein